MKILIIGNSVAAIGAIEAIRSKDYSHEITVVSDEPYPVYSRPLISYLLAKEIKPSQIYYRSSDFYEKNKVKTILGKKVNKVFFDQKMIQLEDGEKVYYDCILLSTGGNPFIPKLEGIDKQGVFCFTKLNDVKRISSQIEKVKKVVVIGGGLIGIKAAEALKKRKKEVIIVELAKHILSLTMDETASSILEKALKKEGIEILTSDTVKEIIGDKEVEAVRLSSGKTIYTEMVIVAIGVLPNIEIFKESGLKIGKGIIVNERMETNLKDVYSAGDVTESYDLISGQYRTIPIWPNAYYQGKVAGSQMVGDKNYIYEGGLMMNSIEVANIPTISVGLVNPSSKDGFEVVKRIDKLSNEYRKILIKDDKIVGALFVGNIDRAGIITGLIRDKINVKRFKKDLVSNTFGLISLPQELRKERLYSLR